MSSFSWPPTGGGGVEIYATFADFPAGSQAGELAVAADTGIIYEWRGASWVAVGGPGYGTYANQTLSNLTSPTAINQDLTFAGTNSAGSHTITAGGTTSAAAGDSISITAGAYTGTSVDVAGGNINISAGLGTGQGNAFINFFMGGGEPSGTNPQQSDLCAQIFPNYDSATNVNYAGFYIQSSDESSAITIQTGDAALGGNGITSMNQDDFTLPFFITANSANPSSADTPGTGLLFSSGTATGAAASSIIFAIPLPGPSGTTPVGANPAVQIAGNNEVQLLSTGNNSNYVGIRAPATGVTSYTVSLPNVAPTTSQVLRATSASALGWSSLTQGNLTEATSSVLTITGGTNAVWGSGTSIQVKQASASQSGYLSSTDWSTFNGKQPSGSYLTSIAVASSNGLAGSSSGGTTPTLTLSTTITGILQGNGTAISAATTTGSGSVVLATSPTLVTPLLGTPTSGTLTNCTGLPAGGIAAIASDTLIGNNTGGSATPTALTVSQVNTMLGTLSNPMTTAGDMIYGGVSGAPSRMSAGTSGQVPLSAGSSVSFASLPGNATALKGPTIQKFTSTGTATGYLFTVSSANATIGATYTNNGNTYTVQSTISAGTLLYCSGANAPTTSGTLTKSSGTGDATITFSAEQALATYTLPTSPAPLYIRVRMLGGGGGGGGSGTGGSSNGGGGTPSSFGATLLLAGGGGGGAGTASGTTGGIGGQVSLGSATGDAFTGGSGSGNTITQSAQYWVGGMGGSSAVGGAGGQGPGNGAGGNGGANTGGGGGGAGTASISAANTGAGGGSGGYIYGLITSPASTYSYSVGSGGSAGGAGSNGYAGGAGGSGIVTVEEFYQ